ncbi:MAG: DUF2277 domain-containing protein [Ignavibacteriales bacterium]|nr:DUF2277 domain-containing protein [Ignavibacteriales bacterium]
MCRNIKKLRRLKGFPKDHELSDAALQFIRKISGYHTPSEANQEQFENAVRDVAIVARTLFRSLKVRHATRHSRHVGYHVHGI